MRDVAVRAAITVMGGRQVTDVEELYRLIGGESAPSRMPRDIYKGLAEILQDLGYRQKWVRPVRGSGRCGYKWVRGPWPIDHGALRGREVETYTNFY